MATSTQSVHSKSLLSSSLLTPDQQEAINAIYESNQLLVAKMGAGKSVIGATAITELLIAGEINRCLIVTTPKIANTVWAQEFAKWDHTQMIAVGAATGDPEQRLSVIKDPAFSVVVVTFNVLPWMKEEGLFKYFDGLLVDESTKLKTAGGAQFKALRPSLKSFNWRCAMTGTPVSEDFMSLYAQCLVVDCGAALGTRKDAFRNRYFYPTDYNQYNWALKQGAEQELLATVEHLIHVMPDYRDELPELREEVYRMALPAGLRAAYDTLKRDSVLDGEAAANAAVLVGKLQQVSSGFLYSETGDTTRISGYRLEALARALDEYRAADIKEGGTGNAVVAYWFQEDLEALKLRFPTAEEITPRNMKEQVRRWNAGEIQILLIHPRSAGHGLQLEQGGNLLFWYTPQWSNDLYHQTNARLWRRGQSRAVTSVSLVAMDTVDEIICARVDSKDKFDAMLTKHFRG